MNLFTIRELSVKVLSYADNWDCQSIWTVCKLWNDICKNEIEDKVDRTTNHLLMLILLSYEDGTYKKWNWPNISRNPNITENVIKKYPHFPWVWGNIGSNPSISVEFIWDNYQLDSRYVQVCQSFTIYEELSNHPKLTWEFVKRIGINENWNWVELSHHKNITLQIIEENISLSWNWYGICSNPNITIDFIIRIRGKAGTYLDWSTLSLNMAIPFDDIKNNMDFPWNWDVILTRRDITWDNVQYILTFYNNTDYYLGLNPNIPINVIRKYKRYLPWDSICQ